MTQVPEKGLVPKMASCASLESPAALGPSRRNPRWVSKMHPLQSPSQQLVGGYYSHFSPPWFHAAAPVCGGNWELSSSQLGSVSVVGSLPDSAVMDAAAPLQLGRTHGGQTSQLLSGVARLSASSTLLRRLSH